MFTRRDKRRHLGPIAPKVGRRIAVMLVAAAALFALTLAPNDSGSAVAQTAPSVTGVAITSSAGSDQTYALGETVRVTLTFSEAVTVTGTPRLAIDMDPADWGRKWAGYEGGSGSSTLTFAYTVVFPNLSTQGLAVLADTLELNGGTIRSSSGADAALGHSGLDHDANHKVESERTPESPSVSGVAISSRPRSNRTYGLDETIRVAVTFSEAVTVTGAPRLAIDMDPADWGRKWADYESGSGSSTLTFAYTVVSPNLSTQGIAVLANTLALNGGAIRSSSGVNAALSHAGLSHDANHKVDSERTAPAPAVTGVAITSSAGPNRTYFLDDTIRVTLSFSEAVTVTGTPRLAIDMDPADWGRKWASYESGGGSSTLTFAYTVVFPNLSTQGIAVLANTLELNGGTIRSASEINAALTHAGLSHDPDHQVDSERTPEPPSVTGVSISSNPDADQTYALGETIRVTLSFDEAVTVSGTPRLAIDMDPAAWGRKWADYESGSGSSSLTFAARVVPPNVSTQGIAVLADTLQLNGGAIRSAAYDVDADLGHAGLEHDADHRVDSRRLPTTNQAPIIHTDAANYRYFTRTAIAPRGFLVTKAFHGIFSDPNGDDLTYSVSVPERHRPLIQLLGVPTPEQIEQTTRSLDTYVRVWFEYDADGDWSAVDPPLPNPLVTTVTVSATDPEGLSTSLSGEFYVWWAIPDTPTGLEAATEMGKLQLTASWNDPGGVQTYRLRWRTSGGEFADDNELLTYDTSAQITVADYGDWQLQVEACIEAGCSEPASHTVTVEGCVAPPQQVSGLGIERAMVAFWEAPDADGCDLSGYELVTTDPDGKQTSARVGSSATSHTLSELEPGAHRLRVRALYRDTDSTNGPQAASAPRAQADFGPRALTNFGPSAQAGVTSGPQAASGPGADATPAPEVEVEVNVPASCALSLATSAWIDVWTTPQFGQSVPAVTAPLKRSDSRAPRVYGVWMNAGGTGTGCVSGGAWLQWRESSTANWWTSHKLENPINVVQGFVYAPMRYRVGRTTEHRIVASDARCIGAVMPDSNDLTDNCAQAHSSNVTSTLLLHDPNDPPDDGSPTSLRVTANNNLGIRVTWQPPASTTNTLSGYIVKWTTGTTSSETSVLATTVRSHTITGLTEGSVYRVRVAARTTDSDSNTADAWNGVALPVTARSGSSSSDSLGASAAMSAEGLEMR